MTLTDPTVLSSLILAALLTAIAVVDLRTLRIPDAANLALGAAGLAATAWLDRDLAAAALGIAGGYGCFWAVAVGFRRWRGYDGLGLGDAKLLAAGGAWVGWAGLPFVVLSAAVAGLLLVAALYAGGWRLTGRTAIPFGPFLASGIALVWTLQLGGYLP